MAACWRQEWRRRRFMIRRTRAKKAGWLHEWVGSGAAGKSRTAGPQRPAGSAMVGSERNRLADDAEYLDDSRWSLGRGGAAGSAPGRRRVLSRGRYFGNDAQANCTVLR